MPQPPQCPYCPKHPMLWKDMSHASILNPDRWRWYCTGCRSAWEPSSEQKLRYA